MERNPEAPARFQDAGYLLYALRNVCVRERDTRDDKIEPAILKWQGFRTSRNKSDTGSDSPAERHGIQVNVQPEAVGIGISDVQSLSGAASHIQDARAWRHRGRKYMGRVARVLGDPQFAKMVRLAQRR